MERKYILHTAGGVQLVWSLTNGGCGVVYHRNDGKMIINTGMQGDFCYC